MTLWPSMVFHTMENFFAVFPHYGKKFSTLWKTFAALLLGAAAASAAGLEWAGWAKDTAANGILAPAQDLIVVVDSKPLGGATNVQVHFTLNGGEEQTRPLAHHGTANYDTHDRWQVNLGQFPEGSKIQYRIDVSGDQPTLPLAPVTVEVNNAAAPLRWLGNLHTEPAPGDLNPGDDLRVFSEMQPPGVAVAAEVGFSTNNGVSWKTMPMARNGSANGNDLWSARLSGFPEGAAIRLYVRAQNAAGDSFWDSNGGTDYRLRVNSPIRDVFPGKGRYAPGETAAIQVELRNPGAAFTGTVQVAVNHLASNLGVIRKPVSLPAGGRQSLSIPWKTPANDFRGYGVDVDLLVDGKVRDVRATALDVSSDWTRFPRMGFFSEYPEGDGAEALAAGLAKYHLNAIQFYDWKWTHDRLVPYGADGQPLNVFTKVGGRVQSFQTVKDKVAAVQSRNMAALSYNLMYGDSGNDAPEHVEWAAFKTPHSTILADIRQHDAGSYRIWVMDVSNPDWKRHIFGQFADAMDRAGFNGIHLDNLGGQWNYKYNSEVGIDERAEFPRFINEARAFLRQAHPGAILTHNDVKSDYLPEIARSDADVYYSEVWTRDTYRELRDNLREVQAAAPGKPVVFAAYINRKPWDEMGDPSQPPLPTFINDASARLLDACLFAHGAGHIELGDEGHLLVNEYFPARTPAMHPGLERALRDLYDFAVRYENLLSLPDAPADPPVTSATHKLSPRGDSGTLWTVARARAEGTLAISLINLNGVDDQWRNPCSNPVPQTNIALQVRTEVPVRRIWYATPDDGLGQPRPLTFQAGRDASGGYVAFTVPRLEFWDLVVLAP